VVRCAGPGALVSAAVYRTRNHADLGRTRIRRKECFERQLGQGDIARVPYVVKVLQLVLHCGDLLGC
jgi:hypothetical protein